MSNCWGCGVEWSGYGGTCNQCRLIEETRKAAEAQQQAAEEAASERRNAERFGRASAAIKAYAAPSKPGPSLTLQDDMRLLTALSNDPAATKEEAERILKYMITKHPDLMSKALFDEEDQAPVKEERTSSVSDFEKFNAVLGLILLCAMLGWIFSLFF